MEIRSQQPEKAELPPLRQDLQLLAGPVLKGGSPTWTLHDPVRNKFFRIGRLEFEMLARWSVSLESPITIEQIFHSINGETTMQVETEDIINLQTFLSSNFLLAPGSQIANNALAHQLDKKQNTILWLIHNYLFFRVPLIKPDNFLTATLPFARLLVCRPMKLLLLISALTGLFLLSRQWQSFTHTFWHFFTWEGAILYGLALFAVKLLHELGHVYTAKHYNLRVPTIGIAVIVLWPMLYSDTTDSWRLTDKKARMHIVGAGIMVELACAVIATFLWSFLPDGSWRSACFFIATSTWVSSLFLNLSPFMRFDGYYLLSDYLDIPNLQERAFTLGRWHLRKLLLGVQAPFPEHFFRDKKDVMILYSYTTWIYRLFVFTTIALVVYHFAFKALGLLLFSIEIFWFILLPILKEMSSWFFLRNQIGWCSKNLYFTLFAVMLLLLSVTLPWPISVTAPSLYTANEALHIYAPFPAQIKAIHIKNGQQVRENEPLFELSSPQLELQIGIVKEKIAALEALLKRQIIHSDLLEPRKIMEKRLASAHTELDGYNQQKKRLLIKAELTGVIVDYDHKLHTGQWINATQNLAKIVTKGKTIIKGFVNEEELVDIKLGANALFYPENRDTRPIPCKISHISDTAVTAFEQPYLTSLFGGEIAAQKDQNKIKSQRSVYRIQFTPNTEAIQMPLQVIRGEVVARGQSSSLYVRAKKQIMAVIVRESGF